MSGLPPPPSAYRGAAMLHAVLAVVILVIAWISGGDLVKTLAVAAVYFVVATGWTWFRFRQRETRAARGGGSPGQGGEGR